MRLPDQENWKSLTAVLPMVVVSFPTALLPGWFQESESAGKSLSPHSPAASSAWRELIHESCVNRIIRGFFLVMFQSPRIFSSRQSTGILTCDTQSFRAQRLEPFGDGNIPR